MAGVDLVAQARGAAEQRRWVDADRAFVEAEAAGLVGPGDLPLVAQVAYAAGDLDRTIATWERAHTEALRGGDQLAAAGAAVRVAMHLLFDTALMAPVRGWLARAERLVGTDGETPVHAWLAVVRNYERMLAGDARGAGAWARRAVELGQRCDPAAAAIGRVAEARSLILTGEVDRGLAQLDEAGVAAVSGEIDPLSTGVVYCELVCALQGLALYDLAEEWTRAMEKWCAGNAIGSLHGRCRVHRAEILRLRGALADAEQQAAQACVELRPYLRRELGWPLCELGRIRLQRGDLVGAEEAFLEAEDVGWDVAPGLPLLHLAQGELALAATTIREAIERPSYVPSKELPPDTDLRRAPLFDAQVEIAIAVGDLDRARAAGAELSRIAERFATKAMIARAKLAEARIRLADGGAAEAAQSFAEATRLWHEVGAPMEAAISRRGLDEARRAQASEPISAGDTTGAQSFRRDGDFWVVAFAGQRALVRDLKGMRYLAQLIASPGREIHVLELVAAESGGVGSEPADLGDAGPMLDARAKEAYRRRLAEIEEDLAEARSLGHASRAAQAEVERDLLARELSRAVGLGGRDRRSAESSERARVAVTRAIRQAIARIRDHHVALGEHLEGALRTGRSCAYMPDLSAGEWEI